MRGRLAVLAAAALALTAGLAALLPAAPAEAQTAQTVQVGSSLIPSGVNAGDSFRLLFVTSTTRNAQSTNIADYNSFVQARANANTALRPFKDEFRALISTATVDARDNTGTAPAGSSYTAGEGVPIYWLGGAKVADDYADLYDGSWDSRSGKTETGGSYGFGVWTGSNADGTAHALYPAGADNVLAGTLASAGKALNVTWRLNSLNARLYALSPVITVVAVPVTKLPPAPEGLRTWVANPTRIVVSWQGMTGITPSGQSPVTGYKLDVSTDGGATWTQAAHKMRATAAVYTDTVTPGTTRHYRVRATSALGDGPWSDTVSATTPAAGAPAAPTGLDWTPGDASMVLTWEDPGNAAITGWEVRYRREDGSTWSAWTAIAGSGKDTTGHTVTGLENGVRYRFELRAVAGAAKGPSTPIIGTPAPIQIGLEAVVDIGSVTLIWDAQKNPAIVGWEYRQHLDRQNVGGMWSGWMPIAGSAAGTSSHTVRGLAPVAYIFEVRPVHAGGAKGRPSARVTATPLRAPASPPETVTGLEAAPGNARVTLTWDRPPRYFYDRGTRIKRWEYRSASGGGWSDWQAMDVGDVWRQPYRIGYTVAGLANGTAHHFQVRAVNKSSTNGAGSDVATATPSESIPALKVTPGTDRLTVSWAGAARPGCGGGGRAGGRR
ncbi:MAG: fibronectin type III domain-containing protein [Rhodospirillales bacterium]|nr:fibronectin type III domain-containing protein [Rhodospirillales bacterium]